MELPPPDAPEADPRDDTASDDASPAEPMDPPPVVSAADRVQSRPTPAPAGGFAAADRVQTQPPPAEKRPFRLSRFVAFGLLGGALAVAAALWLGQDGPDTDLLGRLVDASETFRPELVTVDPSAAEQYIMDAIGWPVRVPELPGVQLVGVGEATVASTPELDVAMPAFRFDAPDGAAVVVFVYDYVLLDGAEGVVSLPEPMYARLAEDPPVDVRRQGGTTVVTWRDRSVLYAAVTEDEALAETIARAIP